jgi:ribonucleotide reductase alpha subunit
VWFNVGVEPEGKIQCSACFILSVDDKMDSILDWYRKEGVIFKGGSGSGVNLSKIRSSKERLAGGGTASGPVSFMRAADASAGVIKSGGKTRRAAKMVVLNVDHPDIGEFIQCKAEEEKKAWTLIDAGYDGSIDGAAYNSVFFQNANNSVRVTDEFMKAVIEDRTWSTRYITTGEICETVRARDLLQKICEATWQCGDPGMQFDTTINAWHTCPNTARINASNPCCVTGDTLIAVADGRNAVPIKELVGQEVPVYAWDHSTRKTVISRMWNVSVKRRNARVYRITLDDGSSFRATDDHLIMLRDGSYRQVQDLQPGDSLNPFHSKIRQPATLRTARRFVYTGASWKAQYRWVWEAAHGKQPEGFHIHHQDFNSLNDRLDNLQLLEADEHKTLHRQNMLGDKNPARRRMTSEWRAHISQATRGEKNPHYGKPHSQETRVKMKVAAAQRWADPQQHAQASASTQKWMAEALEAGRQLGRQAGPRYERCCPACRQNFVTAREEQIFCSWKCRQSPLGLAMSGKKGGISRRGYSPSPEHREKLRLASIAASRPEDKRRAGTQSLRNQSLKAARLLLDAGQDMRLDEWDTLRETAHALGASHVPYRATLQRLFASDAEFLEQAALYNHKVVAVEFDGIEDVYDGTVDTHHNFAIITSQTTSPMSAQALDYSGCFIHNSEYMHLDNSACNLASLNLMKFLRDDNVFDTTAFKHAVDISITAQDILVDNSSYPTEEITANARAFRQLGLGYANLGALLMSLGLPYDSEAGRQYAGAITALMTGEGYLQSARIAEQMGSFSGYAVNREPMLDVIDKHRSYAHKLDPSLVPLDLLSDARKSWEEALASGRKAGYRNAQATVLAPTGTIAFMMDCDTTGVEPDIALVKYKRLVGGGLLKIVNHTVPRALKRLGYDNTEIQDILEYIDEHETIEGAPLLRDEHLAVFDCAFKPNRGVRTIHYLGHVRMMGAVQPFLSGAISKTINMPTETTVLDISEAYLESWRLGLKAVAIYRDGCKRIQPLGTGDKKALTQPVPVVIADPEPTRRRLPMDRQAICHKFDIAGHEGYIHVGFYEDGTPGEIFIKMAKEGSTISGLMDTIATLTSLALQYGVPLEALVSKFGHVRFEPSGFTQNPEIPYAKSLTDYIFRFLGTRFLTKDPRPEVSQGEQPDHRESSRGTVEHAHSLGEQERARAPLNGSTKGATASVATSANGPYPSHGDSPRSASLAAQQTGASLSMTWQSQSDAPSCADCGSIMIRNGACYKCLNCGATSGCS